MDDCVLCNLLNRYNSEEEKMRVVYETDLVLAFHSTKPFAEVHVMIMSKKHISNLFELTDSDNALVRDILEAIKIASEKVFALKGACKLEMYTGKFPTFTAVPHFHCHVIYDSSVD